MRGGPVGRAMRSPNRPTRSTPPRSGDVGPFDDQPHRQTGPRAPTGRRFGPELPGPQGRGTPNAPRDDGDTSFPSLPWTTPAAPSPPARGARSDAPPGARTRGGIVPIAP